MAKRMASHGPSRGSVIGKEFVVGLIAIGLGGYNLAGTYGWINANIEIPQIVANIILLVAGLFLWLTAFKLSRYKYHSKHLF